MAAKEPRTEEGYAAVLEKEPTAVQEEFADWIISKGYDPSSAKNKDEAFREGVRLGKILIMDFQAETADDRRGAAPAAKKVAKKAAKRAPAPVVEEEAEEAPAPRRRGRPKKAAAAAPAAAPPARRGRGRRAAAQPAEELEEAPF